MPSITTGARPTLQHGAGGGPWGPQATDLMPAALGRWGLQASKRHRSHQAKSHANKFFGYLISAAVGLITGNEKFLRNAVGPRLTQLLRLFREAMLGTDVKSKMREFLEPYLQGLSKKYQNGCFGSDPCIASTAERVIWG